MPALFRAILEAGATCELVTSTSEAGIREVPQARPRPFPPHPSCSWPLRLW